MHYLLILGADALLSACFVFQKKYQSIQGTSASATLTFNTFVGLLTGIIFTLLGLFGVFKIEYSAFSAIMAVLATSACVGYSIIGFKILRLGNMPLYTMFLMTGGMLVPYVFGLFFLEEQFSALRLFGVVFIVAAVIIFNTGKIKLTKSQLLMCVAVFFLNGAMSVISKVHQANIIPNAVSVNSESFIIIMSVVKVIFCTPIALALSKKQNDTRLIPSSVFPLFLFTAIADGGSYYLQLIGAVSIPAGVLYPLVTAGSIILSALAGMLVFREKPTKNQWLAMAICLAGTCMFI